MFHLDVSNAKRNQAMSLKVLRKALGDVELLPKRSFASVQEFSAYIEQHKSVILDETEKRMQRPVDQEEHKTFYSGKKNRAPPNR